MKKAIFFTIIILIFVKCGKRKPYSTWKVNGIEYSSNNVEAVVGKAVAILASHEYNRFDISFSGNYLPQSGNWPIRKLHANLQSPDSVTIYFYEGTKIFKPSFNESTRLRAVEYNGKLQVTLPPTWFVDYYNDTDSVLIEGTFNEP